MFCFQCEQTAKGEGCTKIGVCGKQPDTAVLQDLLIYTVKGLSQAGMVAQGETVGIKADETVNPDILSLRELIVYGIKGLAAYADHARILGQEDEKISAYIYEAMAATLDNSLGADELVGLALKCGEVNMRAMELLDAGNTGTYGHPVPTPVPLGAKARQGHSRFRP
jgi:hydroxylamine reductase